MQVDIINHKPSRDRDQINKLKIRENSSPKLEKSLCKSIPVEWLDRNLYNLMKGVRLRHFHRSFDFDLQITFWGQVVVGPMAGLTLLILSKFYGG